MPGVSALAAALVNGSERVAEHVVRAIAALAVDEQVRVRFDRDSRPHRNAPH